jgi:hypothetical protein
MLPEAPDISEDLTLSWLIARAHTALRIVWGERKTIIRFVVLASIIGAIGALGSGEEYSASAKILPYRNGAVSGGGLSGLASLAGVRLPAGAGDQTITADLYPAIVGTQDFRVAVAETPLRFSSVGQKATLVEYFRDLREPPLTELLSRYTIGLPSQVIAHLRLSSGESRPQEKSATVEGLHDSSSLSGYDRAYLNLINELDDRLSVSIDRKTSIITITGIMPDPYASADLVNVTSDKLMEQVIAFDSRKAHEQFRFVNTEYLRAKERYERTQRDLANFADRNRVLVTAISRLEQDRLQRANDVAFEVFQQFSRELEQSRIKINQETPVFTVIERVTVPPDRASPRRGRIMILSVFLGGIFGVAWVGLKKLGSSAVQLAN